jgi:2-phospho-L-lactate guanylyltransferase
VTAAVVHADIPLVTARDIDDLLQASGRYQVVIVPSGDGLGTNALSLRPPTVLVPRFGANSFKVHLQAARSAGLTASVFRRDRLSFDVDRPRDLSLLLRRSRTRPRLAKELGEILHMTSRM